MVGKATSAFVGIATALFMLGGVAVIPASAQTVADLQAQVNALMATITALNAQISALGGGTTGGGTGYTFTRNLKMGDSGEDVRQLQIGLNTNAATRVAASGAGSPGSESTYFGALTKAAVVKFQNLYASDVLTPLGLTSGTGFFGAASRAKAQMVWGGTGTGTGTGAGTGTGTGTVGSLSVSSSIQPANALAPLSAARIPFTKLTLTASGGDVTVNSITAERVGPALDAVLSGVVLVDEDGLQIGIAKTLNSDHRAVLNTPFVVKAGTSRTLTIGGNRPTTSTAAHAGSVGGLTVVAIDAGSSSVSGSLPIAGAYHTINEGLTIGSVTMARGSLDPGAAQTKEVGTPNYNFSSVKVTSGSTEKVYIQSIRWNQTGSAGTGDLTGLKTWVDGASYDAVASSDGKYYSTVFPGKGILMDKGTSKDITISGNIAGGSNRTIAFDIAKLTDIYLVGETYGFGITPPQTNSCGATTGTSCFTSTENPWYDGAVVTVSTGTMTVSSWTSGVAAQNLAVGLLNQPIAGFQVDVKGEPISVGSFAFNFLIATTTATSANLTAADILSVTLMKDDGVVIAGPSDVSSSVAIITTGTITGSITLSNSYTFQPGITNLKLVAKLNTDFASNDTIAASSTPSSEWTSVTGQSTGNSITPSPTSAITGPTQTVKAGALTVSVLSQPPAQTVIAGASQFEFARYTVDASNSGEDVRLTSLPLYFDTTLSTGAAGTRTDLTNCQLYDGATSLTTGSNVKNPASGDTASSTTFTFDGTGVVVTKGTSKTLGLKCNVRVGTTGRFWWGLDTGQAATFTGATGITSGTTITESLNEANGQRMTAASSGSYTTIADSSSAYNYRQLQAGASDVLLAAFKFEAGISEDMVLKQVALELGNTASNSPADLAGQKVTLWDGATKVGEAQFGLGTNPDYATSTLTTFVTIPKGENKTIIVKGSLAGQDAVNGTPGAFLVVNYDGNNNGINGNYSTGADSGATISGSSADVTTNGGRIYRTTPTIADVTTTYNPNRTLSAGSDLYAIRVTAGSGRDMGIHSMSFVIASVGVAETSGWQLFGPNGAVNATSITASSTLNGGYLKVNFDSTSPDRLVSAGTSKDFRLRASSIIGLTSTAVETISINLENDTTDIQAVSPEHGLATSSPGTLLARVPTIVRSGASTTDNFIWTPFSTTTPQAAASIDSNIDWTNSYGMAGFPGVAQDMPTITFSH